MNNQGTMCFLLQAILTKANKTCVCPICDTPYVDGKHALAHCRDKAKQDPTDWQHKGIGYVNTRGGFGAFLDSLREAIGWPDMPRSNLPLAQGKPGPPAYGDCLKMNWIVKWKTRTDSSYERILLQKIAQKARIHYACPICLYGSATGKGVLEHCVEVDDADHTGLLSEDQNQFLENYERSMGQKLERAEVWITYDRAGNPEIENCFGVEKILKFKCKALMPNITK